MPRRGPSLPAESAPVHRRVAPPPPAAAPVHRPPPPAPSPMQAQPQQSGGMLSGLGATMAQGFAFGTGSAMARTAVGSVLGGHSSSSSSQQVASTPAASTPSAPVMSQTQVPEACRLDQQAFTECLRTNTMNAGACEFYFNALKACQHENM